MPPKPSVTKLTAVQLQSLASACGISKTGPRAALVQRLMETHESHKPLPSKTRVLSIDLGIKNLAFTLLTPPSQTESTPAVHAWHKLDLAPASAKVIEVDLEDDAQPNKKGRPEDSVIASSEKWTPPAQDFSPSTLSTIALRLVTDHLLPLHPTHIVIERQRSRSNGGSAVLEWTMRVNSLESMLYAIFATLKELGRWDGSLEPVDPKRVGPFLLGEEDSVPLRSSQARKKQSMTGTDDEQSVKVMKKRSSKESKKLKIDLLGKWLVDGTEVTISGPQAEATRDVFLAKWLPKEKKGSKKKKMATTTMTVETMKKLDDVADSLLQGVAWLRWQENRRVLLGEWRDKLV